MSGLLGPSPTDRSGREFLGFGALVAVLGIAFVALLVEQIGASALISAIR